MNGVIKTINEKKFGFITPTNEDGSPSGEADVFFHESALVGIDFMSLQQGMKVTFDREESEKGPRAANVQVAA